METFTTAREVIFAVGVYNTPKLLELSGISAQDLLDRHSISVHVVLPRVGENLQDHLMTGISYEEGDGVSAGDPLMRQEKEALALAERLYVEHKAGPLTIGGMQSHAFMPTPDAAALLDSLPGAPTAEDAEFHNTVRSILESPDGSSAA